MDSNPSLLSQEEQARIENGEFIGRWVREAYEYMGGWYIAWVLINIFIQFSIFVRSAYLLWVVRKVKVEKKTGIDIQDLCLFFNMIACFCKWECHMWIKDLSFFIYSFQH